MTDFPDSQETEAARAKLAERIWEYKHGTDGSAEQIALCVDILVDCKIADALEAMADRVEEALGVRP
jgi:hypothetical protein